MRLIQKVSRLCDPLGIAAKRFAHRKSDRWNLVYWKRDVLQRNRQEGCNPDNASSLLHEHHCPHEENLYRHAEEALARKSQKLAESQLRFTNPERLAATINDYIEWRAFAFWVRLIVETEGMLSPDMKMLLDERCPRFLDDAEVYRRAHPREREFLWLRLISWLDRETLGFARAEGWLHALGYYATRDPRMDKVTEYWLQCDERWKQNRPSVLPTFEEWRQAALQTKI
jgi:hypothetical protein